jgi:hypothetical protein
MRFFLSLTMERLSALTTHCVAGYGVAPAQEEVLTIQEDAVYNIESIGRVFTPKTREQLEKRLNAEARDGWYFHSVFSVTETSCFGFQKANTYYMVLTRVQPPHAGSNSIT